MRPRAALAALLVVLTIVPGGCVSRGRPAASDDLIRLTFLQVNDHYVLGPVDGGRRGGMARLATLVHEVKRENPNTVFAVGGRTVQDETAYTVAVPSYLVRGGDGYTAFARGKVLGDDTSRPQVAQIVMDAIVSRGAIAPATDGRIGRRD
jgi:2',3'-cyclic-nucleotide 2'-phosphodiesterase (5'-nucleotidase family)